MLKRINLYKFNYIAFAISSLFFISILNVQTIYAGELHFVLNGKSIHLNKKPGYKLNEINLGAGFQYEFNNVNKYWVPFLNAGGFSDSYEKPSYYVGGGISRRYRLPGKSLGLHLDAGLTGFVMTKADVNDNNPFPGILPMVSIGNKNVSLNITYVPAINDTELSTDLWFMQLKFRLGRF